MAPFHLHADPSFNYEILRALSMARYGGAEVSEVLQVAGDIKPGDFESYYNAFNDLALHVKAQADLLDSSKNPISARDAYFRAATYFRNADFFLHGHPNDPRLMTLWSQQTVAFDKAIALLPVPGERLVIKADGFDVNAIFYRTETPGTTGNPKPTIIVGSGFDGAQEEVYHAFGIAALERGYNVITYEGPGQPLPRREQEAGFIHDWEKVVTPVVDYLVQQPSVDAKRIALIGWSMGGYLSVRAAAFEPRIACTAAVDGVYDVFAAFRSMLAPNLRSLYDTGDAAGFKEAAMSSLDKPETPTPFRWAITQGLWSFNVHNPAELMEKVKAMTLGGGVADRVQCPVWVGEAVKDEFFRGQPPLVKEALGDRATLVTLTEDDGASAHCHVGALSVANRHIFDWMGKVFERK
ncbi:Alpha/Beta hydrolase protein [Apodospora peruviana]|uniref:Alpha/Beta hydrolase protein n=1 Tax=Apodospora peruviana TaxID=516989 RepID=A0AAE0M5P8_9PEZI|nr:Alpha/Beta hydrolase protein [Apodospora peruviana]